MIAGVVDIALADLLRHDPTGGRGGRWLCPLPACAEHTNPRRHRSVSLREADGLWNCKRCGGRGKLREHQTALPPRSRQEREAERRRTLTRALERHSNALPRLRSSATPSLASLKGEGYRTTPDASTLSPREAGEGVARHEPGEGNQATHNFRPRLGNLQPLAEVPEGLAYLAIRGFSGNHTLQWLHRAGVRYAADFGRREADSERGAWQGGPAIVFPIRNEVGTLVAAQGRFLSPSAHPKALTFGPRSEGAFITPGVLSRLHAGDPVALCEAPLDALSVALCGLPSLALCGCSGLPGWLLDHAFGRSFILAFDADAAGARATAEVSARLIERGGQIHVALPPTGVKDWNQARQVGLLMGTFPPPADSACVAYQKAIEVFVRAGSSVPPLEEWIRLQTEPWTSEEEATLTEFLRRAGVAASAPP